MADGLNRWTGIGNLAAEPELRVTQNGNAVLNFRIACNESYVDKNNERQERVEFVSITLWGKRGEALAKLLKKGEQVYIEGALRTESYEKDGEKRYVTKVNATNVILRGGGGRGSNDGDERGQQPQRGGGQQRSSGGAKPSGGGYGGGQRQQKSQRNDDFDPGDYPGGGGGGGGYDNGDNEIPFVFDMTMSRDDRV